MTSVDLPQWREAYATALAASEGFRAALAGLGVPERSYRSIRPAMTSAGRPYVYLGILNAGAVEAITAVLQREGAATPEGTGTGPHVRSSPLLGTPHFLPQLSCPQREECLRRPTE
ncbi:hypothetical protein [Streptomyces sp. NPDC005795]|uniref:hypothetical protein n=1 Tax=Streptomyces sp. NPDC005795 TaxID=3154677 RepID=UPI0034009F54